MSDGINILLGPKEAGDEPYLMASRLKGVPVVVGEDRAEAGRYAVQKFAPSCIILDDGFQHLRLERDLNILLVDATTGFGNGFLLPRGILREPIEAVKRASIAMVKGNGRRRLEGSGLEGSGLEGGAGKLLKKMKTPVVRFAYKPSSLTALDGSETLPPDGLKNKRVLAVAGIANPESFFSTLRELKADIVETVVYPDHHAYSKADLNRIEALKKACPRAEMIVTTEKDGVKLKRLQGVQPPPGVQPLDQGGLQIHALSIECSIEGQTEFEKALALFVKEGI